MSRSQPCPFCSEPVNTQAKVCRHCDRDLCVSLFIQPDLSDREIYQLFRSLHASTRMDERFLRFDSLKDLKSFLQKTPDDPIAVSITEQEALQVLNSVPYVKKEHLSNHSDASSASETHSSLLSRTAALIVAMLLVGFSSILLWNHLTDSRQEAGKTPETSLSSHPKAFEMHELSSQAPSPPMRSSPLPGNQEDEWSREDVEELLNATVFIRGEGSVGSGFLISPDGEIVTNRHVIENMRSAKVHLRDGRSFDVWERQIDKDYDLALIRIQVRDAPYLKMGDANSLYPGQTVLTIGNPGGLSWTLTRGVVSYIGRQINGALYIQTDAAINPGNSGGPMITRAREVVGVNTLVARNDRGISFALPINFAYRRGGIAENARLIPRERPTFQGQSSNIHAAFSSPQENGPHPYQADFERLQNEYQRQEAEVRSRGEAILKRVQQLQTELGNRNLPDFQRQRRESELSRLYQEYNVDLRQRQLNARKLYYQGALSLLQRQRWDERFEGHHSSIDSKMEELRAKIQEIESSL